MNGGAFVELQKLYDETHGVNPFEQDSKLTIRSTVEKLDRLIEALGGVSSQKSATRGAKDSGHNQISDESSSRQWIEMSDPNTGDVYFYNTITGASSWDKPEMC